MFAKIQTRQMAAILFFKMAAILAIFPNIELNSQIRIFMTHATTYNM